MQHFNELFTPLAAGMIAIVVHRCLESVLVFNIKCALRDRAYCISTKAVMKEAHYELASPLHALMIIISHQMASLAGLESKGQES